MRWPLKLLVFALSLLPALAHGAIDPRLIDDAIQHAKDFLYKQQKGDNWELGVDQHGDQATGQTALVVYALLSADEDPTKPEIAKAIEYLKKTPTTGIYALGVRCQVWLMLPQGAGVQGVMLKDATAIRKAMIRDGDGKGYWAYNPDLKPWSRSRAQYAVLGMWAAAQAGVEVPKEFWQTVEEAWITDQDPSGGWNYVRKPTDQYPVTPGMTAVGVATLYITQDYLRGSLNHPNLDRGMKWMIENFGKVATNEQFLRDYPYATIYAVERIGVASGLKRFGNIDWYDKCAGWLLTRQLSSGAWPSEMGSNLHSTSFAVLTLARGRAPLTMSKLDYSVEGARKPAPWNQRPRDVANLSRWICRMFEKDLNWQIVDLQAPVEDWHDAQILYLSGNEPLALDDASRQRIKTFIAQGGLVLGNNEGQTPRFSTSFVRLGQELFGGEFRDLPENHVIYTNQQFPREKWKVKPAVRGLSNGVRELMIIPRDDLGQAWQTKDLAKEPYWQLASNVVLYCADAKNLQKRGKSYWIARNTNIKAERTVKLARLKHKFSWDPEPGGWQRLSNLLHNRNKIDVEIAEVDLAGGSLDGFAIAHLTGTQPVKLDDAIRQKLQAFVDAGGTLVIDAAGGLSDFATSIDRELGLIFPEGKLTSIAKDHALYGAGGTALKSINYRPYASRTVGALKDEPRLKGIEINGRLAVIYSREDLSVGMVGQSVDGIIGYDPTTATEIMARVVMYGAKH